MTIKITKLRLAAAILAFAILAPATAWATHVFIDVVDTKFYAAPVTWAKNNNITTGVDPTHFDPDGAVTRGESVTFLKRYDDNIAQPALATATADIATNAANIAAQPTIHWARVTLAGTVEASSGSVTALAAGVGFFDVTFPEPVGNCAIHVTLSHRSNSFGVLFIGGAYASEAYAVVSDNTDSTISNDGTIRVHTYIHSATSAGTLAVATDLPFAVMATC